MAFPWLAQETFDAGSRGNFDSETDADSILDFPHYVELARRGFAPWQGSHALRLALAGASTGYIEEGADFDTALGGTIALWLPICIGADFTLNDGDAIILLALQSTGAVNEAVIGIDRSGSAYRLFAGETGATRTLTIARHNTRWLQVELVATIDAGGADNGTLDFYVDGGQVGAQITGLDQAAIAQARLGLVSGSAAGDTGTVLIGGIIADDARIYPRTRFPVDTSWITRDMTAWVGPCTIDSAVVTGTGNDATLTILDTDIFEATALSFSREPVAFARNAVAGAMEEAANLPVRCSKGAYVQLAGTNPQAWVSIARPSDVIQSAPVYISRGQGRGGFR